MNVLEFCYNKCFGVISGLMGDKTCKNFIPLLMLYALELDKYYLILIKLIEFDVLILA